MAGRRLVSGAAHDPRRSTEVHHDLARVRRLHGKGSGLARAGKTRRLRDPRSGHHARPARAHSQDTSGGDVSGRQTGVPEDGAVRSAIRFRSSVLPTSSRSFLTRLLDAAGPSGFEAMPERVWREEARAFADVSGDVPVTSVAIVNPGGAPTIMLAGHIDEIGVIVAYIDDQGFIYIAPIGGW